MKRLVIELDESLHREIKVEAFKNEKTIKSYVLDIVETEMKKRRESDAE